MLKCISFIFQGPERFGLQGPCNRYTNKSTIKHCKIPAVATCDMHDVTYTHEKTTE